MLLGLQEVLSISVPTSTQVGVGKDAYTGYEVRCKYGVRISVLPDVDVLLPLCMTCLVLSSMCERA